MSITRRAFFKGLMATAAIAPVIVRAESLMKIALPPEKKLILWGNGIIDDTAAMNGLLSGKNVYRQSGELIQSFGKYLEVPQGIYRMSNPVIIGSNTQIRGSTFKFDGHQSAFVRAEGSGSSVINCHFIGEAYSGIQVIGYE